jgi:isopenicillin N synthase-like dioxygenase
LEQKLKWKLNDARVNQGYTADGAEGSAGRRDHKECYEHRRFTNDLCPTEKELEGFRCKLDQFYAQCLSLALNVLRCLALAMKLDEDFFDRITTHADPQLRLLHYPAIERSVIESEGHSRINAHTDFGLCTLLFQDGVGGLEVDPFHTGDFKSATPVPGTVLINIGDLLQRFTKDRVRSTRHRVVAPKTKGDILPPRYSMPFFVHPNPETTIDPITLSAEEKKLYPLINAGVWRDMNTAKNYRLEINEVPAVFSLA